ncbi:bifunctional 5,10-methylenetetrahydrofolate dehydrogenase/5,10-methenyltetrahydrofolate cyclohydrolase [Halalkalibacillus halophilus]|uniref:bifunctional 5,10-methylenetetrahydrofolate dehydrogenase/5,10-methenyltetrahydrofolate cyclohydrolase n=1 Tax=Halalkalibacillus halophilus TaxID=392827 RepID=UPI0004250431|nr:tetrahydrofolate dehydrogenase/cyclohydrolase catalytic domain-containing protein [Halalkalibacillus halophilus]
METRLLYGQPVAQELKNKISTDIHSLKKVGSIPKLVVIIIGEDQASLTYVSMKKKAADKLGMSSEILRFPPSITEQQLKDEISKLNKDMNVHGILLQLPIPNHINEKNVLEWIDPRKDVDGFHPTNVGRLTVGQPGFYPCTPLGIMRILTFYEIPIKGKHVVIVGRSNIVGKPVGQLLLNKDATVTFCHSKTEDLQELTSRADILIIAIGKAHFIKRNAVKKGATVIDIGNTFNEQKQVFGDADMNDLKGHVANITPVPKGVGPMTITMLLYNTVQAAKELNKGE